MQYEQTNPTMEAKPNNEKLECTCFTLEDCEKHDLNPLKRLDIMEEAIEKVQDLADGGDKITSEQYITYFSIRYYGTYTGVLYQKFVAALQDHITEVAMRYELIDKRIRIVVELLFRDGRRAC